MVHIYIQRNIIWWGIWWNKQNWSHISSIYAEIKPFMSPNGAQNGSHSVKQWNQTGMPNHHKHLLLNTLHACTNKQTFLTSTWQKCRSLPNFHHEQNAWTWTSRWHHKHPKDIHVCIYVCTGGPSALFDRNITNVRRLNSLGRKNSIFCHKTSAFFVIKLQNQRNMNPP